MKKNLLSILLFFSVLPCFGYYGQDSVDVAEGCILFCRYKIAAYTLHDKVKMFAAQHTDWKSARAGAGEKGLLDIILIT